MIHKQFGRSFDVLIPFLSQILTRFACFGLCIPYSWVVPGWGIFIYNLIYNIFILQLVRFFSCRISDFDFHSYYLQITLKHRITDFIGFEIVKCLWCPQYDPVIIERTIGLVLGPFTALNRSFLKNCTLTKKAGPKDGHCPSLLRSDRVLIPVPSDNKSGLKQPLDLSSLTVWVEHYLLWRVPLFRF